MHDIPAIKDGNNLLDILTSDGLPPVKMGGNTFVCCPFHQEDTPSCKVTEDKFHCFGCGASGDVIDYWQLSRGIRHGEAIAELAARCGLSPIGDGMRPAVSKPKPRPPSRQIAPRLTPEITAEWVAATQLLAGSAQHIERIAAWRSFPASLVQWAAREGIMGLYRWSGTLRETFLVQRPNPTDGPIPVSIHVRLGPHTHGNATGKNSWRYYPSGCGAWPMVIGDPATATYVFALEGEWDALALIGLMGWHHTWPDRVCVIGVRGAAAFLKFLPHFRLLPTARVLVFADNDIAGNEWAKPDGVVDTLATLVRRVSFFHPAQQGLDLNDLVRAGLTRDAFLAEIVSFLPAKPRRPTGPTFLQWCKNHREDDTSLGRISRAVIRDKNRPRGRLPLRAWEQHWRKHGASDALLDDLRSTWTTYREACTTA